MTDTNHRITFDESLPALIGALGGCMQQEHLEASWVLANASGQLTFISDRPLAEELIAQATQLAKDAIGPYLNPDLSIESVDTPGISSILRGASPYSLIVETGGTRIVVRLIDQRLVGRDWLSPPRTALPGSVPSVVFASLKGGVGRTTALAVVAAHLASQSRKVLVVDLDLEAPGIGSMLLRKDDLPRFGMLDAFVESAISEIDDEFLHDMVSASSFGAGAGLIDIIPATGRIADDNPGNVLAKLARAYVESFDANGEVITFGQRARQLIERLAGLKTYDVVLVDARAGLNESTAAAILALGSDILLFGEDTPQTFAGYRYLLAHMARFPRDSENDWVDRLKMVHAKASPIPDAQQGFRDRAHDIFQELIYVDQVLPAVIAAENDVSAVSLPEFMLDDDNAPHCALPVLMDSNYFGFDPLQKPEALSSALYERTYDALIGWFAQILAASEPESVDAQ